MSSSYLVHSKGPWKKHKYTGVVNGKYVYDYEGVKKLIADRREGDDTIKLDPKNKKNVVDEKPYAYDDVTGEPMYKIRTDKQRREEQQKQQAEYVEKKNAENREAQQKKQAVYTQQKKQENYVKEKMEENPRLAEEHAKSEEYARQKKLDEHSEKTQKYVADKLAENEEKDRQIKEGQKKAKKLARKDKRKKTVDDILKALKIKHSDLIATTISGDYLMHHGIKGQQWGVQNGPPYPLDSEQKSSKELSASKKKKLDTYREKNIKRLKRDENKFAKKTEKAVVKGKIEKANLYSDRVQRAQDAIEVWSKRPYSEIQKNMTKDRLKVAEDFVIGAAAGVGMSILTGGAYAPAALIGQALGGSLGWNAASVVTGDRRRSSRYRNTVRERDNE